MRNFQLAIFFSDTFPLCWWSCYLNHYFRYRWSEVKLQNNCTVWRVYSSTAKMISLLVKQYKIVKRVLVAILASVFFCCCCCFLFVCLFVCFFGFFSVTVKPFPWLTCSTWITWINLLHIYIIKLYQDISLLKLHQKQS